MVNKIVKKFEELNILRRFNIVPKDYFRHLGDKACKLTYDFDKKPTTNNIYNEDSIDDDIVSKFLIYPDNKYLLCWKVLA